VLFPAMIPGYAGPPDRTISLTCGIAMAGHRR
jgi:hypothetical protein